MKRLFVSDLDGTLLGPDARLGDRSRRHLTDLLNTGLSFTLATARSVFSVKKILGDLPLELPMVELGGAYLSDYKTGQHLLVHALPRTISEGVHQTMENHGLPPTFSTFNGEKDLLYIPPSENDGMAWYLKDRYKLQDHRVVLTKNTWRAHEDQVVVMNAIGREAEARALMADLEEQFGDRIVMHLYNNLYQRGWFWLTVHDRNATKEGGLMALLKRLNLTPEHLTVFGDEANDHGMFRMAGRAVAVENAIDTVKALATHHVGPSGEDSVVRFVLEDLGHVERLEDWS